MRMRVVHFRKIAQARNNTTRAVACRGELPLVSTLPEKQFVAERAAAFLTLVGEDDPMSSKLRVLRVHFEGGRSDRN
jgi:hypothetical protein